MTHSPNQILFQKYAKEWKGVTGQKEGRALFPGKRAALRFPCFWKKKSGCNPGCDMLESKA
jgi:hypothetical protein